MNLELKRLAVNGLSMPYADVGDGDTVVFVHGAICDHRIWEPQLTGFEGPFRRIALNQRYFGLDPWLDRPSREWRETHVADLIAFLQTLGVGPVHLVGSSYGGEVVLAAARADGGLDRDRSRRPGYAAAGARGCVACRQRPQGRRRPACHAAVC